MYNYFYSYISKKKFFMEKLTNKEEEIMHILWKLEKAFIKDILAEYNDNKPHYNTLSTMVRNLEDKGYVSHEAFGKTHRYFPIVKKENYRKNFINTAIDNYFNSSYKNVVSFFAKEEKISAKELREILEIIENKKNCFLYKRKNNIKYQLSLQPGIWKRTYLLKYLKEPCNPWNFEIKKTEIANKDNACPKN